MRALKIGVIVWLGCIFASGLLGGWLSFFTGRQSEIPKWNGWNYFWFSVREFITMGALIGVPVAMTAFVIAWLPLMIPSVSAKRHNDGSDTLVKQTPRRPADEPRNDRISG